MPELSGTTYSEIDDANNAPVPNGMPEGMPPSGVNDAWRAGTGAVKRAYDRDHAGAWVTVGGTANAIQLGYAVPPAAYAAGEKFAFRAAAANTGPATLAVGTLAPLPILRRSAAGAVALAGGEIQAGDVVELVHDGSAFQLLGTPAFAGGPLTLPTRMAGAALDEAMASLAVQAVLPIGAAPANFIRVTGSGAINAFDAAQAGARRTLQFAGSAVIANGASLVLPAGVAITTQPGDVAEFVSAGGGVWVCAFYTRANGSALALAGKAQMQAATDAAALVTPAQMLNHPGVAKAWVTFSGIGIVGPMNIIGSYNVGSVIRNAIGDYTINFQPQMPNANYTFLSRGGDNQNRQVLVYGPLSPATTSSFRIATSDTATQVDRAVVSVAFFAQ